MVDKTHPEEPDPALPGDWDPDVDRNDPVLSALIQLAREADRPSMPPPALMEAVRMEARRQLQEEGLVKAGGLKQDPGFRAWVWMMLFGGKAGGQMVRLAAVGAVAFVIGTQTTPTSQPPAAPGVAESAPSAADQPVTTVAYAAPSGVSISKSFTSDPTTRGVASPSDGWTLPQRADTRMVAVGAAQAGTWGEPRTDPAVIAYDQLQMLKISSMALGDERLSSDLQPLEHALAELVMESGFARDPRSLALQSYRQAEQTLAARRPADALQQFGALADAWPGSALGFVSRFQAARIADEELRDYSLALEGYNQLLTDFPALRVPRSQRRVIHDRVQILEAGQRDDWASLRQWDALRRGPNTPDTAPALIAVVAASPSPIVAADAAWRLRDLVVEDGTRRAVDHEAVVQALRQRLAAEPPSADAARIQYALAEVIARRSPNASLAIPEYQRALELGADESIQMMIRARISQLSNPRPAAPRTP